jgi:hypothetical protein
MSNLLFSTYNKGEDRITSTILAVLGRISHDFVTRLFSAFFDEEIQMIQFENQPAGKDSRPDARLHASFSYWIETKAEAGAVEVEQLKNHLKALDEESDSYDEQRLLVLTPDAEKPEALKQVQADDQKAREGASSEGETSRIAWANFSGFVEEIEEILDGDIDLEQDEIAPTERERQLLRELVRFLYASDVVQTTADEVLVVAAGRAWGEYKQLDAYICQPERSFQPTERLAFYTNKAIKDRVPKISGRVENVRLDEEGIQQWKQANDVDDGDEIADQLDELVEKLKEAKGEDGGPDQYGESHKVLFLSPSEDEDTEALNKEIVHQDSSAFVQKQRYVDADWLLDPSTETTEKYN